MAFQYDYVGGPLPQNQNWLRCPKCITPLTYQRKLLIIPPDPPPLMNTRPEPYAVDETNWLVTENDEIITTNDGDPIITSIPNPADPAYVSDLATVIHYPGGVISDLYLDLFDGDPTVDGVSILETITGSATRTDIASQLTLENTVATNAEPIIVIASALGNANVSYAAIYDAATGGTLLGYSTAAATYPTLVETAIVQFSALGLTVDVS